MATSKADVERYMELAKMLQVPPQDIVKFCRQQADTERKIRKEERETQVLMQKEKEEREREAQKEKEEKRSTEGEGREGETVQTTPCSKKTKPPKLWQ